jgi:hypothetical protein
VLCQEHLDKETIVLDELGLQNGLVRADIAVLNGCMAGYEIKTEKDNLSRLPTQILAYSEIFDKAYIIAAERHLNKIMKILPDWWGIYAISTTNDQSCEFDHIRKAVQNVAKDSFSIARLLWKKEVSDILTNNFAESIKKNITKQTLYEMIAERYTPNELSVIALKYMKQRINWRKDLSRSL